MCEAPVDVLSRLKLGREELCQRLVTTLIVGGTYPRWNSRSTPTPEGAEFLRRLDELSFGEATPPLAMVFVDELELERRADGEKGAAPDWAVIWPSRLWIIELKTEHGSHRQDQLPYYFELGAHHFPGRPVDITYLTGPLAKPAPPVGDGQRYAHLMWDSVVPLVREVWGSDGDPRVRGYVDTLATVVDGLEDSWSAQRSALTGTATPDVLGRVTTLDSTPPAPAGTDLMSLIEATAADGMQRGVPCDSSSLDDVLALRQEARELILQAPAHSAVRHVMPWLWSGPETTSGAALTDGGAEHGYEVRLSRYEKTVY
jgi:hypothetical protein